MRWKACSDCPHRHRPLAIGNKRCCKRMREAEKEQGIRAAPGRRCTGRQRGRSWQRKVPRRATPAPFPSSAQRHHGHSGSGGICHMSSITFS
eukprot:1793096-Rhodomonas_salina.2